MSEHDEDIDFDFFAEPAPEPPRRRLVRRPSGPPPGGPSPPRHPGAVAAPAIPILRLGSVIVFAIAAIIILVFAVRSCESSSASAAYKSYMDDVAPIATDSQTVGKQLNQTLANLNLNQKKLETRLQALIDQQNIDIEKARELAPPGPLRSQQEKLVDSLQMRSNALSGLLAVFKKTANQGADQSLEAGRDLSIQMYKAVASDVLWTDMFAAPAAAVLKEEGVSGVSPPSSVFLADPDMAARISMVPIWERIHGVEVSGSTTAGGLHGTNIAYVKVTPDNKTLITDQPTTVQLRQNLTFVVGVENSGDYLEQNVKVNLVIQQDAPDEPVRRSQKILRIYNGETEEVDFKGPFDINTFIRDVPVRIDIVPVAGESNTGNNKATYKVRFSF